MTPPTCRLKTCNQPLFCKGYGCQYPNAKIEEMTTEMNQEQNKTTIREPIFKADAKQLVDMVFDTRLFQDGITRDDMNGIEELISFLLESRFDSYKRVHALMEGIELRKKANQ